MLLLRREVHYDKNGDDLGEMLSIVNASSPEEAVREAFTSIPDFARKQWFILPDDGSDNPPGRWSLLSENGKVRIDWRRISLADPDDNIQRVLTVRESIAIAMDNLASYNTQTAERLINRLEDAILLLDEVKVSLIP